MVEARQEIKRELKRLLKRLFTAVSLFKMDWVHHTVNSPLIGAHQRQ